MLYSLESLLNDGVFPFLRRGAMRPLCNGLETVGRPGSENMCKRELEFPRNLGEPVNSTEAIPGGKPGEQSQARHTSTQVGRERTDAWSRGTAKRRKRSAAGGETGVAVS